MAISARGNCKLKEWHCPETYINVCKDSKHCFNIIFGAAAHNDQTYSLIWEKKKCVNIARPRAGSLLFHTLNDMKLIDNTHVFIIFRILALFETCVVFKEIYQLLIGQWKQLNTTRNTLLFWHSWHRRFSWFSANSRTNSRICGKTSQRWGTSWIIAGSAPYFAQRSQWVDPLASTVGSPATLINLYHLPYYRVVFKYEGHLKKSVPPRCVPMCIFLLAFVGH